MPQGCPECGQVLAEFPDVKLYKCGGCGTVLKAKSRKVEANHSTESSSQSTDSCVANVQLDNASEAEEAISSNHDIGNLQNGDHLQDEENTGYQDEHEYFSSTSATNALPTSPTVNINGVKIVISFSFLAG